LADAKGLYLYVAPGGGKLWRCDYAFNGKRRTASFGKYPLISLAQAREKRDEIKQAIAEGRDPTTPERRGASFEEMAREWFQANVGKWKTSYSWRLWRRIEHDVFPALGAKGVGEIRPLEVLEVLRAIEGREAVYTARRIHQMVNQVFKYAIVSGYASVNPAADLHVALKAVPKGKGRAALKAGDLPEFFHKLKTTPMEEATRLGLLAVAHVFVRTNEIRFGRWSEFDFGKGVWTIPAERMKMKREHRVPLSRQAHVIFKRLRELADGSEWVLPGPVTVKPVSENCLIYALYRVGYHSRATVHGFRATASTILNESERFDPQAIEHQLAHAPDDAIRAAYDRGERWQSRVKMMQWYSDLLDDYERRGMKNDFSDLLE
jgi:integrase